jgi:hypothetical protein
MMTSWDIAILGWEYEGDQFCPDCAKKRWTELHLERCRVGLDHDITPLTRYTLAETAIERGYEDYDDRLDAFLARHPAYEHLLASEAQRHEFCLRGYDASCDQCVECGKTLTPSRWEEAPDKPGAFMR